MIRLLLAVLAVFLLAGPLLAQTKAASIPKVSAEVDRLTASAREKGMTVVVIAPPTEAADSQAMMDQMRAARFLAARARIREITASAPTLGPAVRETLNRIAAAGGRYWWLMGLATAALGAFIGWLALRPVVRISGRLAAERQARRHTFLSVPDTTPTTADRARALIFKTLFGVAFALLIYAIALLVAVALDSGFEPTRRLIFELLTAFLIYRLLRFGLAWPLTAYDDARNRLVGLDDAQAGQVYSSLSLWAAVILVPLAALRMLLIEGRPASMGGNTYGALTPEHASLLAIIAVLLGTVAVVVFTAVNWRSMQTMFAPKAVEMPSTWHRVSSLLARATPVIVLAYCAFSVIAFLFRLGANQAAPATTIVAPFAIGYIALILYGLALIAIQAFYGARESRWLARLEAERRERERAAAADRERLADGEEMMVSHDAMTDAETLDTEPPVFRPLLRGFLEQAAGITVVIVAFGELGRFWGVPVGEAGNPWAGFLDMVLAVALAWIAYNAITLAVDRRMAEEAGPDVDEEAMGNEGGAGASRLATLLPILRWVLISIVVVAAIITVLSRFGIDIGPLLASAGVIGIAVGFGAQKLIQDIFSGFFFLLDDAFRRGEYIDIEGTKGTVEKISIRSFQLRHHLGALHTIPFGEIKQLTNFSRDWVLMKLPLRVTYDTDVEKVRKLIKKLGQELLEHPEIGHTFMQPLKSQGVYRMEDSAMIIRVKFMTRPGEQFVTRKVVYAAIQELFAKEHIRFAHKEVTVRLADGEADQLSEEQKKAVTAAAREVVDAEEAAVEAGGGSPR